MQSGRPLITTRLRSRLSVLTVSLSELQTIAEELRPYTADAMKIEVAPWIRDYVVDMEDLYTELKLEKIHNKPTGQDVKTLQNYKELFAECKTTEAVDPPDLDFWREPTEKKMRKEKHKSKSKRKRGHKILIKGDPGMGKTTQCKKICWDWARRLFVHFHIVFFVFLKLVKPGDAIESAIIEQSPYMKGLKITKVKLRSIFELDGISCLIILDGLDEHALGSNENVLSIIRGENYLGCSIIVTSRPHSTRGIEGYFPVVVRIEGFTRNKAEQFASKILNDEKLIEGVLNYNPTNDEEGFILRYQSRYVPIHKSPILLSFLCLLAREDDIDLSNTKMHTGEIYTRMVRCLYKKYIIRKGLDFENTKFEAAMTKIGKLAMETLLSGDPLLRRAYVVKEVGEHAFDYGLLIGHEDAYRLIRDETADIWVTFPHRTIQEFLASFYFIWMLDKGIEIKSLLGAKCDKPIFLTNPLFLQFCLWFLCDDQKYFSFRNRYTVYQRLIRCCVELMNSKVLDLETYDSIYPALDISSQSVYAKDKFRVIFLTDILAKCNQTSSLISPRRVLNATLRSVNLFLKSITSIQIGRERYRVWSCKYCEMMIKAKNGDIRHLGIILKHYTKLMDKPAVHLCLDEPSNLTRQISYPHAKKVYIKHPTGGHQNDKNSVILIPHLTHLCLQKVRHQLFMKEVLNELSDVAQYLTHLNLIDCEHMVGELPVLFESTWPHLTYLNLLGTQLSETDLGFLCLACNEPVKILPNLTSLCLTISNDLKLYFCNHFFTVPWQNLKRLSVKFEFEPDINNALC